CRCIELQLNQGARGYQDFVSFADQETTGDADATADRRTGPGTAPGSPAMAPGGDGTNSGAKQGTGTGADCAVQKGRLHLGASRFTLDVVALVGAHIFVLVDAAKYVRGNGHVRSTRCPQAGEFESDSTGLCQALARLGIGDAPGNYGTSR